MSSIPSVEGAEPAARDMDAGAEAAQQTAQRADMNTEPPAEPAGGSGPAADGGSWQGSWAWWQGARGEPSAYGVWDTPGTGGGALDGEWGSCVGRWSHGSSWRDGPRSREWESGYRWRPGPADTASWRKWAADFYGWSRVGSEWPDTWSWDQCYGGDESGRDREPSQPDENELVPEWDGKTVPLWTYERRVKIFELCTAIPPKRRGGRLLSRLTGDAEVKTANLNPKALGGPDGVQVLLRYLHKKFDRQETMKVVMLVEEFTYELGRNAGEEIVDFAMRYEARVIT